MPEPRMTTLTSSCPESLLSCSRPSVLLDAESLNTELPAHEANCAARASGDDLLDVDDAVAHYMRKMPNFVSAIGAFRAAEMPSASTRRVSSGSMIPSSQRRAVE
jgi:hypothetical protein